MADEQAAGEREEATGGTTGGTVGSGQDPDMRSPGGEGTTAGTEQGPYSGTTTGLGGAGESTAGGGVTPDLAGGTAPERLRPGAAREARERSQDGG
jgi:hypothetical protein